VNRNLILLAFLRTTAQISAVFAGVEFGRHYVAHSMTTGTLLLVSISMLVSFAAFLAIRLVTPGR
jgi:hypothetical protein